MERKKVILNQIYSQIKERLVNLVYNPGQPLNEKELAEEFSTSRTPVREALLLLAAEGWVEISPRGGRYVKPMDFRYVRQALEFQYAMDLYTAEYAVRNITDQEIAELQELAKEIQKALDDHDQKLRFDLDTKFCEKFRTFNTNEIMRENYTATREHLHRAWKYGWESIEPRFIGSAENGSMEIANALEKRDLEECRLQIQKHMLSVKDFMRELLF